MANTRERREELIECVIYSTLELMAKAGVDTHFDGTVLHSREPSDLTHRVTVASAVAIAGAIMALNSAIMNAEFEKLPKMKALEKLPRGSRTKPADPSFAEWLAEISKRAK